MGESRFSTPLDLYHKKISGDEILDNPAMARGREFEQEALLWFQTNHGGVLKPVCAEHDSIPWMAASIDGWDFFTNSAIEVKIPTAKNYKFAEVPPFYHLLQMQHQMHVLSIGQMNYVVYSPEKKDGYVIHVTKDSDLVDRMLKAEEDFYRCLISYKVPAG
jgi:putative phage-type endonuclease